MEPTEDGQRLRIVWRDGAVHEYEPRDIRLACPCAGCVDEFTGRPILDPASVAADIKPVSIEYVGRYALKFTWPDGHDTGIYPYDLMRRLGAGGGERVGGEEGTGSQGTEPATAPEADAAAAKEADMRAADGPEKGG